MKKTVAIQIVVVCLVFLCAGLRAETLPKTGTFNIQSIFKAGTPTKFNDDYSHNGLAGVTFNEEGSGPLHLGKVACSVSSFSRNDVNKVIGFCNFEDKEGDSIFVQYAGNGSTKGEFTSTNEIIGGTGKFDGIRGNGQGACTNTHKHSEFPCTGQFDYQLPE